MFTFNIVFFGSTNNKRLEINNLIQLSSSITNKKNRKKTWHAHTMYSSAIGQDIKLDIISNNDVLYRNTHVGVYCIDLSQPLNTQLIKEEIDLYRAENKGPLVLIGTDIDKTVFADPARELAQLAQTFDCKHHYVTSTKTSQGIEAIASALNLIIDQRIRSMRLEDFQAKLQNNKTLYDAFAKFNKACTKLSDRQYRLITLETEKLISKLSTRFNRDMKEDIHQFNQLCTQYIQKPNYFIEYFIPAVVALSFSIFVLGPIIWATPSILLTLVCGGFSLGCAFMIDNNLRTYVDEPAKALDYFCGKVLDWESDIAAMDNVSNTIADYLTGYIMEKERQRTKKNKPLEGSKSLKIAAVICEKIHKGASVLEAYDEVFTNNPSNLSHALKNNSIFKSQPLCLMREAAEIYNNAKPIG